MKALSFEQELNSCMIMFEAMGLQYFSLKSLTVHNFRARPSVPRTIFMLFLVTLITILMIIFIIYDKSLPKEIITAKNVLMQMVRKSLNFNLVLVVWTSLIQSFLSTEKVKKLFFNLTEVSQLSHQYFHMTFDAKRLKRLACRRTLLMMIFLMTVHGGVLIISILHFGMMLKPLVAILPVMFLFTVVNKFLFYVGIVNSQLEFLAQLIENLFVWQEPVKLIDNKIILSIKPSRSADDPLRKLRAARKIYNKIFENSILINESNGLTLLVLLISLVISLMTSGYEIFVVIIGGLPMDYLISRCIITSFDR